ncbi:hypothetical protein AAC387_Pa07g1611 [Persea americana]
MTRENDRNVSFMSPSKGLRGGLKAPNHHDRSIVLDEIFNDDELAQRKAEEAASRRYQAAEWLRQMDQVASGILPEEPTEEEFCLALRNGLILCNVLNKVNPGAVSKVVENPVIDVQVTEGAAQSAIQYFENMRNFLVAVGEMKLLTFEASDLEKGGSSVKVVDCILCLKGYHEWKQAGGIGVWSDVCLEESKAAGALSSLFARFGLVLLRAFLTECNGVEDLPLNAMLVDTVLGKAVKELNELLIFQSNQLGLLLKEVLKDLQQKQLEELKSFYNETKVQVQGIQLKWGDELRKLGRHIRGLELAATSYHKVLEENRMLYNQVQDLKGCIRVYCRVRPFLPGQADMHSTVDYIGEDGNIMIVNPRKQGKDARRVFSFNKVFGTNVTQEQVFADTQPLIRSVLDGFNVCIFAYGQTGSGKTYTMSGPDLTTKETWGVNYRALKDLFQISKERRDVISYEVGVQMIEIYNEQVRDLLVADGSNRRLDIRNNSQQNGLNVPDASLVSVSCTQDVLELMRIGQKNRAVGATALNERSSRSHSVLTVHVYGKELVSGSILRGCLHLVDLAGSERVDKSEAAGDRLKEAQHINRSLSALGDVISALAQKSSHIPYRNSKLTQVLQESLGGHAKTLMFVHINPDVNAYGETISTLKFAERVASIELGAAHSNKETGEIRELKEEIANMKSALERKEAEMEQLKSGSICRAVQDAQKIRAVSPLRLQRYGTTSNLKAEIIPRPVDDTRNTEVRSSSSGKQRTNRLPFGLSDKDPDPKLPFIAEESFINSRKLRSPSPPVRRSTSTDRGALMRSRKLDTLDNPTTAKVNFPVKVAMDKSIAAASVLSANESSRANLGSQELSKQENISELLFQLHRAHPRKIYPEHEEEQFKLALNVRQGGIRKSKPENKTKIKHQLPSKILKPDEPKTLQCDMGTVEKLEEAQKSDFSEIENGNGLVVSPVHSDLNIKKLHQNLTRISQSTEPRGLVQHVEPPLTGKQENKLPNGIHRNGKEGTNTSVPELRRSRSTPRGKFTIFP